MIVGTCWRAIIGDDCRSTADDVAVLDPNVSVRCLYQFRFIAGYTG